jgi:glycine/D-amino acid oxidase-like deaminating enzyme
MNQGSDVLVIGAGVIGAATAYFAAQQGLSVTVIDKGLPACQRHFLLLRGEHPRVGQGTRPGA